jgi:hypothetical protein
MSLLSRSQKFVVVAALLIIGITLISGGCQRWVENPIWVQQGIGQPGYDEIDWGKTISFIFGVMVIGAALVFWLEFRKKRQLPPFADPKNEQGRKAD